MARHVRGAQCCAHRFWQAPRMTPATLHTVDGMPRQAYTVGEVGEMLAMSEAHVRRAIRRGELGAIKGAKEYRIPVRALQEFLAKADSG